MRPAASLTREPMKPTSRNYGELRALGIQMLEDTVTDTWTDFNAHDPGITILEAMCYAMTEIAYRMSLPIKDLLAPGDGPQQDQAFFTAAEILPTEPMTHLDWRKLIIDRVDGVKNAWLNPVTKRVHVDRADRTQSYKASDLTDSKPKHYDMRGLYEILVEGRDRDGISNQLMEQEVAKLFLKHRALCEDLSEVRALRNQGITVCAEIDLDPQVNSTQTFARIVFAIEEYLSPPLKRYTLDELQEKKIPVDRIFSGPRMENGFILDNDLLAAEPRRTVYGSDLIREIMCVPGVLSIDGLELNYADDRTRLEDGQAWELPVNAKAKPRLSLDESKFCLIKDTLPVRIDTDGAAFGNAIDALRLRKQLPDELATDLSVPLGERRPVGDYQTVQKEFPQVYGLAGKGLPSHVSNERRAQAQQLKGYLLLFDQFLADFLAQLDHVGDLLALDPPEVTYFSKTVEGLEDVRSLLHADDEADYAAKLAAIHKTFDDLRGVTRRNRVLDYHLARFGERFDQYAMLFEDLLANGFADRDAKDILRDKVRFLKEYPRISRRRGSGFDLKGASWNDDQNIPGLQHRAGRLLGFSDIGRRNIADADEEGMFVIENILLRPRNQDVNFIKTCFDGDEQVPMDPYSYRIHVVVPAFAGRFGNEREFDRMAFRRFVEKTIREETPAHVMPKICFVDKVSMKKLETLYRVWLGHRASANPDSPQSNTALNALLTELAKLQNEYPARKLHGLGNEGDPQPIILNKTHLGDPDDDPN